MKALEARRGEYLAGLAAILVPAVEAYLAQVRAYGRAWALLQRTCPGEGYCFWLTDRWRAHERQRRQVVNDALIFDREDLAADIAAEIAAVDRLVKRRLPFAVIDGGKK
jgi:hypothetical protein